MIRSCRCGVVIEVPLSREKRGVWGCCPICGQLIHFRFNGDGRLKKTTYPKKRRTPRGMVIKKLKILKNNNVMV